VSDVAERRGRPGRVVAAGALACAVALAGCGSSHPRPAADRAIRALEAQARPIGRGTRFHAPARGPTLGRCRPSLGRREAVHVEVFADNRVVLIPAGIGVQGPVTRAEGRIVAARCYSELVTLDPTGVALGRAGARLTLADLFRSWGEPLTRTRLAGFRAPAGTRVRAFVDGRPRAGDPGTIRLANHDEVVLEVGPHVPPHRRYTVPPGP
jgi:hypothetical protein